MYNLFHIEYFIYYRGYYNVAIEPLLVTVSQMTIINANNEKKEKKKKEERAKNKSSFHQNHQICVSL